jgi:hypothetical protein
MNKDSSLDKNPKKDDTPKKDGLCDEYPKSCIWIVWCIVVIICLVIYYHINKSDLTDAEYIIELAKLGYKDNNEAKVRYDKLQNEIEKYAHNKVNVDCRFLTGTSRNICNTKRNTKKNELKKEYINNKLNDNDKKLLTLYKNQNIWTEIIIYGIILCIGVPVFIAGVTLIPS